MSGVAQYFETGLLAGRLLSARMMGAAVDPRAIELENELQATSTALGLTAHVGDVDALRRNVHRVSGHVPGTWFETGIDFVLLQAHLKIFSMLAVTKPHAVAEGLLAFRPLAEQTRLHLAALAVPDHVSSFIDRLCASTSDVPSFLNQSEDLFGQSEAALVRLRSFAQQAPMPQEHSGSPSGPNPVRPDPEKSKTLVDGYLDRLKNHRAIALLVATATIVGGTAQFTDSISKLSGAVVGMFRTAVALPIIPGDSGWLLLGDLDPGGTRFIREPLYETYKSMYSESTLLPRKGEQLLLLAERNVIIAGYKTLGLSKQFTPPWQMNVLSDTDYTGVKLPKGAVVEVRDVSLGSFPGQPIVLWVRVAAPPR